MYERQFSGLTEASADLNGLVFFAERRNLDSARVPSHLSWPLNNFAEFHVLFEKSAVAINIAVERAVHLSVSYYSENNKYKPTTHL